MGSMPNLPRVLAVFRNALTSPDAPGSEEVAEAFVRLIEMESGKRSFRTVVSPGFQPLLDPYNRAAEQLRPIVAPVFNVPELVTVERTSAAAD
jgi:hypothetical protein